MEKENEPNYRVIELQTRKTLAQQLEASIQVAMTLETRREHKTTINLAGHNIYRAGVRAAYIALGLVSTDGRPEVDSREIRALRKGMENHLGENGSI